MTRPSTRGKAPVTPHGNPTLVLTHSAAQRDGGSAELDFRFFFFPPLFSSSFFLHHYPSQKCHGRIWKNTAYRQEASNCLAWFGVRRAVSDQPPTHLLPLILVRYKTTYLHLAISAASAASTRQDLQVRRRDRIATETKTRTTDVKGEKHHGHIRSQTSTSLILAHSRPLKLPQHAAPSCRLDIGRHGLFLPFPPPSLYAYLVHLIPGLSRAPNLDWTDSRRAAPSTGRPEAPGRHRMIVLTDRREGVKGETKRRATRYPQTESRLRTYRQDILSGHDNVEVVRGSQRKSF